MPEATLTQTPTNPVTEINKVVHAENGYFVYAFEILLKESVVTSTYLMIFSCTIDTYINNLKSK